MPSPAPSVFARLTALADSTRSRLLAVLERHELTVSELRAVVQLPQSTVSRHLKVLSDDGWITSRAEGPSRLYRMEPRLEPSAKRLWQVVRDEVGASRTSAQDARRLEGVLARRRSRSQEFFSSASGQWDALRAELFGRSTDTALLALLDERWTVGDLGCGTGQLSAALAPFVGQVVAVDASKAMLAAARRRLAGTRNVELRHGELEALPIDSGTLDVALLFLVLHYVAEPPRALAEVQRVLRPEGRLLIVDMMPHDREEYRHQMGHLWQGFSEDQLDGWLGEAGFVRPRYCTLPADPEARGPMLFVSTAEKK